MAEGNKTVVYAALAGNVAIAVTKFIAAAMTGSSSMLTEGVHSLVDSGNQGLLLYGLARAAKPADDEHPLGYGRELYFWSFVVALLLFSTGAGVSIYEGIVHLRQPEEIDRPLINFGVLGIAFLFEGASWTVAMREFRSQKGGRGWWAALKDSKDPATFVALAEDSAALAGIMVAAAFIGLALWTGDPRYDGMGSIVIGCILAVVAIMLAREAKGLLIGERAGPGLRLALRRIADGMGGVVLVNEVLTVHLAPDQVIAAISLDFADGLDIGRVEELIRRIQADCRSAHPEIVRLFVMPQPREAPETPKDHGDPEALAAVGTIEEKRDGRG